MEDSKISNKELLLSDGSRLEHVAKVPETFLDKMTVLYGPSGTGKTTILKEIMYICRNHVPNVFVISPTNFSNEEFTTTLPSNHILSGTDDKKTIDFIDNFLTRQREVSNIYKSAWKIEFLKPIFDRIVDSYMKIEANDLIRAAHRKIITIQKSWEMSDLEKQGKIGNIRTDLIKSLVKVYRRCIRKHKKMLLKPGGLPAKERLLVEFMDVNPRSMLILDDCSGKFKTWVKLNKKAFGEIFYQFRHSFGTTIICAHDDTNIPSDYRDNVMNSIYTCMQTATRAFSRTGFDVRTRRFMQMCASAVFGSGDDEKNYKKLVHFNNAVHPFRYIEANTYPKFRMCSMVTWKMDAIIKSKLPGLHEKNSIWDSYIKKSESKGSAEKRKSELGLRSY